MSKQTKPTQSPNKVDEPLSTYEQTVIDTDVIPKGYLPLKEGMDKVRSYVKSLYETSI